MNDEIQPGKLYKIDLESSQTKESIWGIKLDKISNHRKDYIIWIHADDQSFFLAIEMTQINKFDVHYQLKQDYSLSHGFVFLKGSERIWLSKELWHRLKCVI